MLSQRVHGQEHRALNVPGIPLFLRAHVEDDGVRVFPKGGQVLRQADLHLAAHDIGRDHAAEDDRVLGRGEGRGIGQIEVFEIENRHVAADGGRQNVDALVHAAAPDALRAQQTPGLLLHGQL